jgi:pyruvate-formate lyase
MPNLQIEAELQALEYGKITSNRPIFNVDREIHFTKIYQEYAQAHPWLREIKCLEIQTREILQPIQTGDWFAGRLDRMLVGIDPERGGLTDAAYFCQTEQLTDHLNSPTLKPQVAADIHSLLDFWKTEATGRKCREAFPEIVQKGLPSDDYYKGKEISFPMYGLGGPCLDYEKLVKLGIPGLREEIKQNRTKNHIRPEIDPVFYDCLEMALDIITAAAKRYAAEAKTLAQLTPNEQVRERYHLISQSLYKIAQYPPEHLHEAIQLVWLYSLIALPRNYGRMDVYLGDFLVRDLESGYFTEKQAGEMVTGLWKMIIARGDNFNNRIMIGGKGRSNENNADEFAKLALQVQSLVNDAIPQLSLRWYAGMNPEIWNLAMQVIRQGSTFPILYNDDVNIPAVQKAFQVSPDEAEQYMPYGCGEFVIDHKSIGSPDAAINLLKALDVTLHNGFDLFFQEKRGLALGSLPDFESFEALQKAFVRQVEYRVELLAQAQSKIYQVTGQNAAFPFLSLLYDDCNAAGRPLLSGGVRYAGGTLESFGNNTTADALLAIKKAVYEDKVISAADLLEILRKNFEGHAREWNYLKSLPKFGNDHSEADAMSIWVNQVVCEAAKKHGVANKLASFLVVLINNGDSVLFGKTTAASADGRKAGEPISNGNQPGAGNDQNGLTALLNSMSKLDASLHAGATHNLKISRKLFTENPEQVTALIKGYFSRGGTQLMITVADAAELEKALQEPEKYSNLIVRVGGYSERFVNLPREIQKEVIRRTLY